MVEKFGLNKSKVPTVMTFRKRGSRKISFKNRMCEDFAVCQGWVGEKLFRAFQDAQLLWMPKSVVDFWFCKKKKKKRKLPVWRDPAYPGTWGYSNLFITKGLILSLMRNEVVNPMSLLKVGSNIWFNLVPEQLFKSYQYHLWKVIPTLHRVVPEEEFNREPCLETIRGWIKTKQLYFKIKAFYGTENRGHFHSSSL